jgi:hypothetical protein
MVLAASQPIWTYLARRFGYYLILRSHRNLVVGVVKGKVSGKGVRRVSAVGIHSDGRLGRCK